MKILFVCHRLPYPPIRGGKIRPFQMINHLSRKHSVVVASLAQTEQEWSDGENLKEHCDEVIAELLPDSTRWLRASTALFTALPSSVAYFWSPQLKQRITEKIANTRFDIIMVHCAFVAQYVTDYRGCFRILDFGDLDSAKWADYAHRKRFPISAGYALESNKLLKYEKRLAREFDQCTVTTDGEAQNFRFLGVSTPCEVIPNGVDSAYFASRENLTQDEDIIVFLGRMDYFPNIDAVYYFASEILPRVRKAKPNVKFRIIGSNPSRRVRQLERIHGVTVTGHVPDVRPQVRGAAVSVAPLRIARGTQNKILESMALGIPVVASPQAAKGILANNMEHLLVADNPTLFADHVVNLLKDYRLRRHLAEAARVQIEKSHSWPNSMAVLDRLLPPLKSKKAHSR
jgi:sugar transferase (PEP-CTERM/EpsH1 system associated)